MNKRIDSNSILGAAVKGGAVLMALVVILLSSYNAWSAVMFLRTDDYVRAAAAPLLFDVAVLLYLGEFAYVARGGAQRLIALAGLVLALVGTVALNVLYLDVSSSGLTMGEFYREQLAWYLVRAFELQMALHLVLHIGLILFSPGVMTAMREQAREWRILSRAHERADDLTDELVEEAADLIGHNDRSSVLARLTTRTGVDLAAIDRRAALPASSTIPVQAYAVNVPVSAGVPVSQPPAQPAPAKRVSTRRRESPTTDDELRPESSGAAAEPDWEAGMIARARAVAAEDPHYAALLGKVESAGGWRSPALAWRAWLADEGVDTPTAEHLRDAIGVIDEERKKSRRRTGK